ncbi:MAG TPA: glycosyltransferase family 4 protein, partial [bacterium]|nr:glycosyltransferase family 4 protein [bacterium]
MRVLALLNGYRPPDENEFVFRQVRSLEKSGVKISKIYCGRGASPRDFFRSLGCIIKTCMTTKPDLIHCHFGSITSLLGVIASLTFNIKLVVTFRGSDLAGVYVNYKRIKTLSKISVFISKFCAIFADQIIVVSRELFQDLPKRCQEKATIIPTGIPLETFYPMGRELARQALGISNAKKIILCDAHSPTKNVKLAEAVFLHVKAYRPDVELIVLKDTPPSKVPLFLNAADVLLYTSFREGSPNIVKEAMACNLPVVSVKCGDVEERLDGVFPSKVLPPDTDLLASAVCEVLDLNIRSNGREKISEISEDKIALKIKEVYFKALTTSLSRA